MMKQKGSTLIIVLCTLGILAVLIGITVGIFVSNWNAAVADEEVIVALHKDSENNLADVSLKAIEVSQVAESLKNDAVEYMVGVMKGRYGEDGSQASWAWLQENNPGIDSSVRVKVAQIIEGGRTNFKVSQTKKLEACRAYKQSLRTAVGGSLKRLMGFPTINMDEVCEIVTSQHAKDAFETGVDTGIKGL